MSRLFPKRKSNQALFAVALLLISITLFSSSYISQYATRAATAPNTPQHAVAFALSNSSVVVKWADSSGPTNLATNFILENSTDGVNFGNQMTLPANTRSYTYSSLSSNTKYFFRIKASNVNGQSAPSLIASTHTGGYIIDVKQYGGNGGNIEGGVLIESSDPVNGYIVTGKFSGSVTFGATTLVASNDADHFLLKLDSNKNVIWAKKLAISAANYEINDIYINPSGEIAVTGYIPQTSIYFVNEEEVIYDYNKLLVAKYNALGNKIWEYVLTNMDTNPTEGESREESYTGVSVVVGSTGMVTVGYNEHTLYDSAYNVLMDNFVMRQIYNDGSSGLVRRIIGNNTLTVEEPTYEAHAKDLRIESFDVVYAIGERSYEQGMYGSAQPYQFRIDAAMWRFDTTFYLPFYDNYDGSRYYMWSLTLNDPANKYFLYERMVADTQTSQPYAIPTIGRYPVPGGSTVYNTLLPVSDRIKSFVNSKVFADQAGQVWITKSAPANEKDIRKYAGSPTSTQSYLWSHGASTPDFSDSVMGYFSDLVIVGVHSGTNSYGLLTRDAGPNNDLFVATYSDTGSFTQNENVAPNATVTISCQGGGTNCATVNVTASTSDTGSGMGAGAQMRFSVDGTTWSNPVAYAANSTYTIGSTATKLYAQFKDSMHNWTGIIESNTRQPTSLPGTYEYWRDNNAGFSASDLLNPTISGVNGNPDGDGMVNLLEYAFVKNPKVADSPEQSFYLLNNKFTIKYRRIVGASDLQFSMVSTSTLTVNTVYVNDPFDTISTLPTGVGFETITASDQQTISQVGPTRFYKLQVTKTTGSPAPPPQVSLSPNFSTLYNSLRIISEGRGRVTSGNDINCGTSCFKEVPTSNNSVILTAVPDGGYTLDSWMGGSCSGRNPTCTVNVTASTTVKAKFIPTPDTDVPTINNPQPQGTVQSVGQVSFWTNEKAYCRYSFEADKSYASMKDVYAIPTAGVFHSFNPGKLSNGLKTIYIKCKDLAGNINSSDYQLTFTLATPVSKIQITGMRTISEGAKANLFRVTYFDWVAVGGEGSYKGYLMNEALSEAASKEVATASSSERIYQDTSENIYNAFTGSIEITKAMLDRYQDYAKKPYSDIKDKFYIRIEAWKNGQMIPGVENRTPNFTIERAQ